MQNLKYSLPILLVAALLAGCGSSSSAKLGNEST